MSDTGDSWKLTLPCSKAEAESIAMMDAPDENSGDITDEQAGWPVIMTSEPDPDRPDDWQLEAYFDHDPAPALIAQVAALAPSATGIAPIIAHLPPDDWVTMSQAGLEPVMAGRFFVHTPQHRDAVPNGAVAFEIDAGLAFGTGQHETTSGCLILIDHLEAMLATQGATVTRHVDLGTGTGLLAFAAMHVWPDAIAVATDIDPISIDVTADNAAINHVLLGNAPGQLQLAVADGTDHPVVQAHAPFDLVIANILAGPLIDMAADIAGIARSNGHIILAGLLITQADKVIAAYAAQGASLIHRIERGDWACLLLQKVDARRN
jgi:ribosomal protein L11 methyltransferase